MSFRKPYDLATTAASIAHASHNRLAGMIEDALKMERERCARIAEERIPATVGCSMSAPVIQACEDIADAIRSPRAALERDRSESAQQAQQMRSGDDGQ